MAKRAWWLGGAVLLAAVAACGSHGPSPGGEPSPPSSPGASQPSGPEGSQPSTPGASQPPMPDGSQPPAADGSQPSGPEAGAPAASGAPVDSAQGGTTRSVRPIGGAGDESALALAASADGSVTVLTAIGWQPWAPAIPSALGLVRLDPSGAVTWSKELPNPAHAPLRDFAMAVSPAGNVFLALRIDCGTSAGCAFDAGGGPLAGSVLLKLEPPGTLAWARTLDGALTSGVAVDAQGSAAVAFDDGSRVQLRKYRWDGATEWTVASPAPHVFESLHTALAFAPDGGVAVGAGLGLWKLDAAGNVLWSSPLAAEQGGGAVVRSLGTTTAGTVVTTFQFYGTVGYAGLVAHAHVGSGILLVVAEHDGSPRLARTFAGDAGVIAAAVDPAGRVAVMTRGGPCDDIVWRWNLAGDLLWDRPLAKSGCELAPALAVDPASHEVVVAGSFWTPADFGAGPVTPRGGSDAVVVRLAP
jgi:hypothetical protein